MRRMFSEKEIKQFSEEVAEAILEEDVEVGGDLSVTGDAEVGGDLSVTGDVSGDNISGNSIIENMSGYVVTLGTGGVVEKTPVYYSVVKNGNKLTFVLFLGVKRTDTQTSFENVAQFELPTEVIDKLYPYTQGGLTDVLACQKLVAMQTNSLTTAKSCYMYARKTTDNKRVNFQIYDIDLSLNIEYLIRAEFTFLLSDNMIPNP